MNFDGNVDISLFHSKEIMLSVVIITKLLSNFHSLYNSVIDSADKGTKLTSSPVTTYTDEHYTCLLSPWKTKDYHCTGYIGNTWSFFGLLKVNGGSISLTICKHRKKLDRHSHRSMNGTCSLHLSPITFGCLFGNNEIVL